MSNEGILESLASLVDIHGGSTVRSKLDFLKQLPEFINQLQSIVAPTVTNNPQCLDSTEDLISDIVKKNRVTDVVISPSGTHRKPIRVYVDGCFDLMHSGHYNALRQAKLLGDILIAGIHSDEEIQRNKGPPVMNNEERIALVKNCKWVGEIAFGVPYSPSVELLDRINADFVVHGDDIPVNSEGVSAYDSVIKAGRCKIIKRTEGISTTNLVGRLLMHYREDHMPSQLKYENPDNKQTVNPPMTVFLPTARRISQFQSGAASTTPTPSPSGTASNNVVYIAGSFDMLHPGHVEFLEKAKALGDFLLVGIYDDETVKRLTGRYPIMSLHERVFNVLASKHVNDVIIGAPYLITRELLTTMNIKVVASVTNIQFDSIKDTTDPFSVAKDLGVYKPIEVSCDLTVAKIGERIVSDQRIQEVYNRKKKKEEDYVKTNTESRQHLFEI